MAADAYITTAAGQLRNAIAALQDDIHQTQVSAFAQEEQIKHDISRKDYEVESLKIELRARETLEHGEKKQEVANRIHQLETQLGSEKQAVDRQSIDAANAVGAKVRLLEKLQSLASKLESLAASAR